MEVRNAAAFCFYNLKGDGLTSEGCLVEAFLNSPAFEDGIDPLICALEDTSSLMPEVIVSIPNRIMDPITASDDIVRWQREAYQLPQLVLSVYQQARDESLKVECLDTIDRMPAEGFGGIDAELVKFER